MRARVQDTLLGDVYNNRNFFFGNHFPWLDVQLKRKRTRD
jgi:hypothetical protein